MTEDMVSEGFVATLAKPGGNITGMSILSPELDGKRLDILIEAVPGVQKIAVFAESRITLPLIPHRGVEKQDAFCCGERGDIETAGQQASWIDVDEVLPAMENAKKLRCASHLLSGHTFVLD